jgi:hypothetical protein
VTRDETTVDAAQPRWWSVRPAHNLKPATYTCPFCRGYLSSMSEHVLIAPEGDTSRRRHAHTACALAARRNGRLPSRDEWLAGRPRRGILGRLLRRSPASHG